MSRVDENREAQRVEDQRRLQEQDKTKRQKNSAEFGRMMQSQGKPAPGAGTPAKAQSGTKAGSAALMARQGIASRNFTQTLHKAGESSVDTTRQEAKARRSEMDDTQLRTDEKQGHIDGDRVQRQGDRLAAIAGDERHEHQQEGNLGGGGGGGAASDGGAGMDFGGGGQPGAGLAAGTSAVAQAEQAQGPQAPQIPSELIRELVNKVYAGVTPEGLSQFTVELKSDVLGGARLDIVAEGGKISCTVHTSDKNTGRLIKASEGALARAFAQKGLTLERLAVA